MSIKGWFGDPSGRFAQRWYDGHEWTDQVVGANGTTVTDPLPASDQPYPPPMRTQVVPPAASVASAGPAASAGPSPTPSAPARPPSAPRPASAAHAPALFAPGAQPSAGGQVRLRPGATLPIALIGWLLVVASLVGLPWLSQGPLDANFFDFTDAVWDGGNGNFIVKVYAGGLAYLLLVGALLGALLAGLPLPGRPGAATMWRIVASFGSAVAVVLHTVTLTQVSKGPIDPAFGAWLGVVGYFVLILAMVIGHYTHRSR